MVLSRLSQSLDWKIEGSEGSALFVCQCAVES